MANPPNILPSDLVMSTAEAMIHQRLTVVRELSDIFDVTLDAYDFQRLAFWVASGVDKNLTVFVEEIP